MFRFRYRPAGHDTCIRTVDEGEDKVVYQVVLRYERCKEGGEAGNAERDGKPHTSVGEFFKDYVYPQRVQAETAVFVRNKNGMISVLVHLFHAIPVHGAFSDHLFRRHLIQFK